MTDERSATQATTETHTFAGYSAEMCRVINSAIEAKNQFAVMYDGDDYQVSVMIPPAVVVEPEKVVA